MAQFCAPAFVTGKECVLLCGRLGGWCARRRCCPFPIDRRSEQDQAFPVLAMLLERIALCDLQPLAAGVIHQLFKGLRSWHEFFVPDSQKRSSVDDRAACASDLGRVPRSA